MQQNTSSYNTTTHNTTHHKKITTQHNIKTKAHTHNTIQYNTIQYTTECTQNEMLNELCKRIICYWWNHETLILAHWPENC